MPPASCWRCRTPTWRTPGCRHDTLKGGRPLWTLVLRAPRRELRPELEQAGGSLVVLHRPAAMPAIDAWGSGGDAFPLMLSVKQQLDPRGILNPGRFIGGI